VRFPLRIHKSKLPKPNGTTIAISDATAPRSHVYTRHLEIFAKFFLPSPAASCCPSLPSIRFLGAGWSCAIRSLTLWLWLSFLPVPVCFSGPCVAFWIYLFGSGSLVLLVAVLSLLECSVNRPHATAHGSNVCEWFFFYCDEA